MTKAQMEEIKETIIEAAKVLNNKLKLIDFKVEYLRRELSYFDTSEISDQNERILEELEEVKAWLYSFIRQSPAETGPEDTEQSDSTGS